MAQNSNPKDDEEIKLSDLFAALWSHKILISLFTILSFSLASYYILKAEKKFSVQAIFQIQELSNNTGFDLPGDLGALASLAGINADDAMSSTDLLLERTSGREFIIEISENLALKNDFYFNPYNPNYKDPLWKVTIKKIIGWQELDIEKDAIIERNILKNFRKNISFNTTSAGAISISVTHSNPKKASDYANQLMDSLRNLVESESKEAQDFRLNYLSETLADALQEIERSQENLKNYAFENSALAQENFISDSLKLDQIRMEKRKVEEVANLLFVIENQIKLGDINSKTFEELRSAHPLVDDVEFRRILGMSETISAWSWPKISTINAISATLRDRLKRLDVDIKNIEENAKLYATSAEDLARLTRDAKIAEATYTVLIEQVKSQTLAAGFQPNTFKVFEVATPALAQVYPKRSLVLVLGALIGLLVGCIVAFVNAISKGVYYSKSTLISDTSPGLSLRLKSIKRLSRKPIADIISFVSKHRIFVLDKAALMLSNKKIIYVLNSGGRSSAVQVARTLAIKSAESGRNIVLYDTTDQTEIEINDAVIENASDAHIVSLADNINLLSGAGGVSLLTSNKFNSTIKDLTKRFDQVFLCTSSKNSQLGLMALAEFTPGLVVITSLRKTRKIDIKNIKAKQPIDLLFHD